MGNDYYAGLLADHAHTLERLSLKLAGKLSRGEPVSDMEGALIRDRIRHIVTVAEVAFPEAARQSAPSTDASEE